MRKPSFIHGLELVLLFGGRCACTERTRGWVFRPGVDVKLESVELGFWEFQAGFAEQNGGDIEASGIL